MPVFDFNHTPETEDTKGAECTYSYFLFGCSSGSAGAADSGIRHKRTAVGASHLRSL